MDKYLKNIIFFLSIICFTMEFLKHCRNIFPTGQEMGDHKAKYIKG